LGRAGLRFEKIYLAPEAPEQPNRAHNKWDKWNGRSQNDVFDSPHDAKFHSTDAALPEMWSLVNLGGVVILNVNDGSLP
jgi:hypothetical protein